MFFEFFCNSFYQLQSFLSNIVLQNETHVKLKFHGTDTDTDTDTDFLADFPRAEVDVSGARESRRGARGPFSSSTKSADFCPTRAFPREDVRWGCARIHMYVYCT